MKEHTRYLLHAIFTCKRKKNPIVVRTKVGGVQSDHLRLMFPNEL